MTPHSQSQPGTPAAPGFSKLAPPRNFASWQRIAAFGELTTTCRQSVSLGAAEVYARRCTLSS